MGEIFNAKGLIWFNVVGLCNMTFHRYEVSGRSGLALNMPTINTLPTNRVNDSLIVDTKWYIILEIDMVCYIKGHQYSIMYVWKWNPFYPRLWRIGSRKQQAIMQFKSAKKSILIPIPIVTDLLCSPIHMGKWNGSFSRTSRREINTWLWKHPFPPKVITI